MQADQKLTFYLLLRCRWQGGREGGREGRIYRGGGRQGVREVGRDQFSFLDCKIRVASHSFTGSFSDLVSFETKGHAYGLGNPQA